MPETILVGISRDGDFLEMDIAGVDFGAVFPLKAIGVIKDSEDRSGRDVLVLDHSELRFERGDFSKEVVVSFNKRRLLGVVDTRRVGRSNGRQDGRKDAEPGHVVCF